MTKRVLLTGAGGFVGSHALRHLLAETDWDVVCPVTFQHKGLSDRIRLAMDDMPDAAYRVKVVRCDLTTPISVVTDHEFGPIDYVLNFASESHVDRSIMYPAAFIQNNVALITNLLDWARLRSGAIKAFIQISTDEVYGPAAPGTAHREWEDLHLPSNPYSASKAAQEDIVFAYWRTYDLPVILTNTMNIIGETQDPEKFFPMVVKRVLAGEPMMIHASESGVPGSRFYLHARNQADGVLRVLQHHITPFATNVRFTPTGPLRDAYHVMDEESGESLRYSDGGIMPYRYHIVGEREVDNLTMAQMIADAVGKPLKYDLVDFHGSRPGHDLRYALSGEKMQIVLGWKPPVPLDESLRRTVEWTLAHPEWLKTR
jgi:dTDP-glucose 4,6-dehydratase